nr:MAG TPA: hypothetical protein [Bacteriophage sp.]
MNINHQTNWIFLYDLLSNLCFYSYFCQINK